MIDHYTNKIQNVIQMELFKAQKSIKIAMAWFTNDLLFQPLLMKLQVGVTVEIILNKDEINDSKDNPVDFNEFINLGGILRWNDTKQLLHEKFCIIDDRVVLSGSYNWTNKAEINDEILTVFREESKTTEFFNKKFDSLSEKFKPEIATGLRIAQRTNKYPNGLFDFTPIIVTPKFIERDHKSIFYVDDKDSPGAQCEYAEFPDLKFYDIIKEYGELLLAKKSNSQSCLLDSKKRIPITDYVISSITDARDCNDQKSDKYWIEIEDYWILVNPTKRRVLSPFRKSYTYSYIFCVRSSQMQKEAVLDSDGNMLLDYEYDSCDVYSTGKESYVILKNNGKYGLFLVNEYKLFNCEFTEEQVKKYLDYKYSQKLFHFIRKY